MWPALSASATCLMGIRLPALSNVPRSFPVARGVYRGTVGNSSSCNALCRFHPFAFLLNSPATLATEQTIMAINTTMHIATINRSYESKLFALVRAVGTFGTELVPTGSSLWIIGMIIFCYWHPYSPLCVKCLPLLYVDSPVFC